MSADTPEPGGGPLAPPPGEALRDVLLSQVGELEAAGHRDAAGSLRAAVETWWAAQAAWNGRLAEMLSLHHEINNALVGVRGNAQLLLMGPSGQQAGVKERLEVVLRESKRIEDAAAKLRDLKTRLAGPGPAARAA